MVNFENKEHYNVYDLKRLISLLRSPNGCPWDAEQTHKSIRRNFLEEAYEAVEAIDEQDPVHLCEELGDVLTQVVFHADIESDAGHFDLDDVADMVCKKLILRHPHVFGETAVRGSADVLDNWDAIKRVEKKQETVTDSLKSVAKSLPALWRAEKLQKKAAKAGFDWPEISGALDKLREEITELNEAITSGVGREEELGDLLFSAVNVARFLDVDPEDALGLSCDKFINRFELVEAAATAQEKSLINMHLNEIDELYNAAKKALKNKITL